jgi:hypothetical protein
MNVNYLYHLTSQEVSQMKPYRLLSLSLGVLLQVCQCLAMEEGPVSSQKALEGEKYERGLLDRSFQVILRHYKDDWAEVCEQAKVFQKDQGVWGYGGWGRWLLDLNKAKELYHEKVQIVKKDFEEIFYDPHKLDTTSEKLSANILAQASLIWRYYNAQCEQIIVEYPRKYAKTLTPFTSYEETLEFQLILLLEELMTQSQEALLEEIEELKQSSNLKMSESFLNRLRRNPLKDNFHNIFKMQYREIKTLGGAETYLEKLRVREQERQQQLELNKQEQWKKLNQKNLIEIPLPPPLPPKYTPEVKRGGLQIDKIEKALKLKDIIEVKQKPSLEKPRISLGKKKESLPPDLINEIKNPPKLKSVRDRVLKDITPQQATNEYLSFFNHIMQRRQAIKGDSEEDQETSYNSFDDE